MSGQSTIRKFLITITFLSVLAAYGCGEYTPVSPSQDGTTMPGVENPLFVRLLSTPEESSYMSTAGSSMITEKMISAEDGGIIDNGYFSLYFPPGALDEDTMISIEMPEYPSAMVRLEPHGIQFNKDVILSLEMDKTDAADSRVLWFNEETGIWEDIGGYMDGSIVKAGLQHFSQYASSPNG
ncbi:MAG: hypothetical protein GF417_13545 [Candidatus Latescibacteria bacterium]|nr:hypothetical protein [bacterium]MBD3425453.1 hypothetical protein [Candidatus Latescibacterota bacterium]